MQVGLKVWRVEIIKSFRFSALVFGSHFTFAQTLRLAAPSPVEVRALSRPRGAGRGVTGGGEAVPAAPAPPLTQPSQTTAREHPEQPRCRGTEQARPTRVVLGCISSPSVLTWSHRSPTPAPGQRRAVPRDAGAAGGSPRAPCARAAPREGWPRCIAVRGAGPHSHLKIESSPCWGAAALPEEPGNGSPEGLSPARRPCPSRAALTEPQPSRRHLRSPSPSAHPQEALATPRGEGLGLRARG